MVAIEQQLAAAADCARRGDWPGYAAALSAVREALLGNAACASDELVRRHLDILGAAAPQHDPEGCVAELLALARELRERHADETLTLPAPGAAAPLDLRGLQPPEPIWRILDELQRAPHAGLRVILPHEPMPLYGLLRERGFRWSGKTRDEGGYELFIETA
ncbi:MAG TPA: DUF2249 domain-containing protein [Burkholderiales bacterium]|jgi:hypothetical protein|nr:DUF2249 domain-containing protein [Burkholderiales bacterium]